MAPFDESVSGADARAAFAAQSAALVARCLDGDEAAWPQIVARYERLVFSVLRRFPLPPQEAADIFTDVFTDLWRYLEQLENPAAIGGWLGRVAWRRALERMRALRRSGQLDGLAVEPVAGVDTEAGLLELERAQQVREALANLPPRCRDLFTWLFYTEPAPSYAEVADRLGLATNSIGFIRGRCLSKLRRELEARAAVAGGPPGTA